jgi:hypothetical protein
MARTRGPRVRRRRERLRPEYRPGPDLGLYPIVTSQYSSTALYQVSYHIQWLFF